MRVALAVCPNGLGHFRRACRVLARLSERVRGCDIDILCERWQWLRARDSLATIPELAQARFHHDLMAPGVTWEREPSAYNDGRLTLWEDRVRKSGVLARADLVLSDNLVGVLSVRSDAVLLGSFLWSEVLSAAHPDSASVRAFAQHERGLLTRIEPPMLGTGDLAMPEAASRPRWVSLPWMRAPAPPSEPDPKQVAVLGGATGVDDELLANCVRNLCSRGLEPWVPKELSRAVPVGVKVFDHSSAAYSSVAAVVARPGAGTLTDCVAHRIPIVCHYDPANPEMAHNAKRIQSLGLGQDLAASEPREVAQAVESVLAQGDAQKRHFDAVTLNGDQAAADWLLNFSRRRQAQGSPVGL